MKFKVIKIIEHKLYVSVLLLIVALSSIVICWQYLQLKAIYKDEISTELNTIKNQWGKSITAYSSIFEIIEKKVAKKEIQQHLISSLLKQFYVNANNSSINGAIIPFSDINWQGINESYSINKYGVIPSKKISVELEKNLKTFPGKLYLYNNENKAFRGHELYLSAGLTDKHKNYAGYLSILLDLESWIKVLKQQFSKHNYSMTLVDSQKEILFSTEETLESHKISGSIEEPEYQDITFVEHLKLDPYPYFSLFGYNKSVFYKQLFERVYPLLIVIWSTGFVFLCAHICYNARLKGNIRSGFKLQINTLTRNNKNYLQKNLQITRELEQSNDLAEAHELAMRERKKLETQLGNRISESIADIREIIRILAESHEGTIDIIINSDKQIELLACINEKLAYLSLFCIGKGQITQINLNSIINDAIKIYAVETLTSNLAVRIEIHKKIKYLCFDELLLRQLLANLLRESICGARPNGHVNISVTVRKDRDIDIMVFVIKDDGFGVNKDVGRVDEEQQFPTSCLSLDLDSIQGVVESLNGSLIIEYVIDQRKTITLTLPYEYKNSSKRVDGVWANVIPFKKS